MNRIRYLGLVLSTASLMAVGACSNMSQRDKATAVGAGVGAVGGAALSGGGALGTVGGAAVGGVIGNQVGKEKEKK
jgi:osmotically inducible lipoprotein OsmB